ncbi:heme ABC transporter substrate-binding protein IsdE [Ornithinibacillus halotolerans]|uniref:High-affinity heme uptake system protein IsdE n=1 Tax=Ornithinibacillus halotolerans TaxID=1274357 RepID=A0A916RX15_9BACI|nr:heme ABC transporter substrate-binding protein IsdE [Ornithinibacillus halotolerans]GGA74409.1 heme ABC transporter substrate-binding protein IsdE [Ornithinibacillus halotolerans]
MKKKIGLLLMLFALVVLAACGSADATSDVKKSDSTNESQGKSAKEEEHRIVNTTVALVEITDVLGIDLVGVPTTYKDLPERYDGLPEVGLAMEPDMELILSLKPTDVLTVTTLTEYVEEKFTQTNTPATYIDLESVEGMYEGILHLGEKYDREEKAEEIVNGFKEKMIEIEEKVKDEEPPTVLILFGVPGSYLVATEDSYVGDLVRRAGGVNAVDAEGYEYIAANTENLQQSNPDVILRMAHGMPEEVVEMFDKDFKENDIWKHFKAVQNNLVYDLEETRFGSTANLALTEAMEELVEMLYPDLAN